METTEKVKAYIALKELSQRERLLKKINKSSSVAFELSSILIAFGFIFLMQPSSSEVYVILTFLVLLLSLILGISRKIHERIDALVEFINLENSKE